MRTVLRLTLLLVSLAVLTSPIEARLDPKVWRQVEADAKRLFGQPGEKQAKLGLLAQALEDGEKRAWKLLILGLEKESQAWIDGARAVQAKEAEIAAVESLPFRKRSPANQTDLTRWKDELLQLEAVVAEQRDIVEAFTIALADGPAALRKDLVRAVKSGSDWTVRASAARILARHLGEKLSADAFRLLLEIDKDARVRMAALESLRGLEVPPPEGEPEEKPEDGAAPALDLQTTVEGFILGRLADKDWGVQLLAVEIVGQRDMRRAVPHLINALGFTSPRVGEAVGTLLQTFTGENFDPYADVWAKWWEENSEKFGTGEKVKGDRGEREFSDIHFYGLPVKSDRILFIIDTSDSMKLKTENENPAEKWKPSGPVTPKDGDGPPPPPPEEILSGPKIDVAKHELKKAIKNLPETAKFNIISFDSTIVVWNEKMVDATDSNKDEALKWVRALKPKGSTYIDGALRTAFRMAGLGAVDKAYPEVSIDTMVLLSDGAPTDSGAPGKQARLMDDEIILQHVREWNVHKRVVIHTVGVDMLPYIEFLRKLAAENGGKYVDR